MAVPPPPSKAELRVKLRAARRTFVAELSETERMRAGERAAALALPHLRPGQVVALYQPTPYEFSPEPLSRSLAREGFRLAIPRVRSDTSKIEFAAWALPDQLISGPFGIRQPTPGQVSLIPDVVIAPLIGFDRGGKRLGQGGGFYDRAFARYPDAVRIGYAWSVQEIEAVPTDLWDQPLHAIVTEREWVSCQPT